MRLWGFLNRRGKDFEIIKSYFVGLPEISGSPVFLGVSSIKNGGMIKYKAEGSRQDSGGKSAERKTQQ